MSRNNKRMKHRRETRILLLGAGGILHLSVVRSLAAAGWKHIHEYVVDPVPVRMSIHSRYLHSSTTSDGSYQELSAVDLTAEYHAWEQPVLLPVSEKAVKWCITNRSELEAKFKIPDLPDSSALKCVMDKWSLHNWLQTHGLPSPRSVIYDPADPNWQETIESLQFPLILKSKLEVPFKIIETIDSRSNLVEVERELKNRPEDNLLQEQVNGKDCDCSLLAEDGEIVAYTMQTALVNQNLRYGTTIKLYYDEQFLEIVANIIRTLNWSGVAHMDFRYNPENRTFHLIDFNPRYWATLLGSVCAGVNIASLQVERALGLGASSEGMKDEVIHFMMNRDGLMELYKRLFRRSERLSQFRIRNSELWFTVQDPMPEFKRRMRGKTIGFNRAA